ncbi:lactate dehydrogenase [Mucilaginibacter sp. X5P1]|uniref:lactate dehydrogenase n=1 Tax=Mucilaginibacter sp. X5P1 TaxID=2723088 RepID=UPI0016071FA3|nr:lactate dehydrogenase [Mucilaginibacter sp. X5P1]MBB6140829.1 D-lactate dehydrogenase [Mucilaginibacter sp. X5P1]
MKVVAYSVKPAERESLAKANQKKHDITLIFNSLSLETAIFAAGKQAVMVLSSDDVSAEVINKLAELGIKYITTRSAVTSHIDKLAAASNGIKLANVPDQLNIAEQTIRNLDSWEMNKCVGKACACAKDCKR